MSHATARRIRRAPTLPRPLVKAGVQPTGSHPNRIYRKVPRVWPYAVNDNPCGTIDVNRVKRGKKVKGINA